MKLVLPLLLFTFHATAFGACINLNGIYKADEKTAMRFTQNSCLSLRIEFGQIQEDGRIDWYKIPLKSLLNGSTTCDAFGCVTGRADEKKVELARDREWLAYDPRHGDCSYNQERYFFSNHGKLVQSRNVYACKDGYSGWLERNLTVIK